MHIACQINQNSKKIKRWSRENERTTVKVVGLESNIGINAGEKRENNKTEGFLVKFQKIVIDRTFDSAPWEWAKTLRAQLTKWISNRLIYFLLTILFYFFNFFGLTLLMFFN